MVLVAVLDSGVECEVVDVGVVSLFVVVVYVVCGNGVVVVYVLLGYEMEACDCV